MSTKKLIGPFAQVVTVDESNAILSQAGVLIEDNTILAVDSYEKLLDSVNEQETSVERINEEMTLLPGLIDSHTHICFAGSRAHDYSLRAQGKSYLEIAQSGGGIMSTVNATRKASLEELVDGILDRAQKQMLMGVTTCEVKSGYGLTVKDELKMLQAIHLANEHLPIDLIPTALPAHVCPPEFDNPELYLSYIIKELMPEIVQQGLAKRADIFIEEGAFTPQIAADYLRACQELGFSITIHADQFSVGGSELAAEFRAVSADHLEASTQKEIDMLSKSKTIGTVLPGASLGLGMPFAPVRKMIDAGMNVALASDWNPGSAPMGNLLAQAALIGIYEKIGSMDILQSITRSTARALELEDRGVLAKNMKADMIAFPCGHFEEILYRQGQLQPAAVWKEGKKVK